jgi:uncharacterized protein DUF4401
MIATASELLEALEARGLVPQGSSMRAGAAAQPDRPWFVGFLLGAAGWFAGLFLVAFLVLAMFKANSGGAALVVGIVLIASAWGLFFVDREGAFLTQLALALSVAGQFAALFGLAESVFKSSSGANGIAGMALAALVLQVALVVAMPSRLHRTMSTLFACAAWALLVRYGLWDRSASGTPVSAGSLPLALLGWAIAWPPIGALLLYLIRTEPAWMARGHREVLRAASVGLIVALAVATLASDPFDALPWLGSGGRKDGWLALWPLLSAIAALAALAAAFALGQRALAALCIAAALAHLSHFYYAMGTTLVLKSALLAGMGAMLLAGARALKRGAS